MRSVSKTLLRVGALLAIGAGFGVALTAHAQEHDNLGYQDTPMLGKWHVHDGARPQPKVIDPGAASTQEAPGKPPSDAIILFDGKDLSHWRKRANNDDAAWNVADGVLTVKPGAGDIATRAEIGDCQFHVEWSAPVPAVGRGQGRGNSGVIFFGRYEIQVLDSYNAQTYPDGQAAALYGSYPPLVNATRPPGAWNVYDILFTVPRFDGEKLVKPGYFTVMHNGVAVHNHVELLGDSNHRQLPSYHAHPPQGSLILQDHGNRVRYRNIWYRELKDYDQP